MDGATEKKWFVYLADHHDGPFSLTEVSEQLAQGRVTTHTFVWAEGMPDWKVMSDVPDFSHLTETKGGASAPLMAPSGMVHEIEDIHNLAPPEDLSMGGGIPHEMSQGIPEAAPPADSSVGVPVGDEKTGDLNPEDLKRVRETGQIDLATLGMKPGGLAGPGYDPTGMHEPRGRGLIKKLVPLLLLLGIGGGGFWAYRAGHLNALLQNPNLKMPAFQIPGVNVGEYLEKAKVLTQTSMDWVIAKLPFLERFASGVPSLSDVSPEELEELKSVVKSKLDETGPRFAIAFSKADPLAPAFYVASNLPDGSHIGIHLSGVSDTLLNQIYFSLDNVLILNKHFVKTPVLKRADGQPIPKGEYEVFLKPGDANPVFATAQPMNVKLPRSLPKDTPILAAKTYFIGGAKDATYASRLKEFHDKLKARSDSELAEIKQFTATIESQFASTQTKFGLIRKSRTGTPAAKQWDEFRNEWGKLQTQLNQIYNQWTPEVLQQEYFHGSLYSLVRDAIAAVQRVHAFQHSFFVGVKDPRAFEIQLGQVTSGAQTAISVLKSKIETIEKLPPTENGMPQLDG